MYDRIMKRLHWPFTAMGEYKYVIVVMKARTKTVFEKCHCVSAFSEGHHFFVFWSPSDCDVLLSVTNPYFFYCFNKSSFVLLHSLYNDSKHGMQKTHGTSFACCLQLCGTDTGTPVTIACHQCGPSS